MPKELRVKELGELANSFKKQYTFDAIKTAITDLGYEVELEPVDKLLAIHFHYGESKNLLENLTGNTIPDGDTKIVRATRGTARKILAYFIEAQKNNQPLSSGEKIMATKSKNTKTNKQPAKGKAKAKGKVKGTAGKKVGVIHEIRFMIEREKGASKVEIVEHLMNKFLDRGEKQLASTINTQLTVSRLPEQTGGKLVKKDDPKRGKVYYLKGARKAK